MKSNNSIQLLRHATLVVNMAGHKILIDPMLSDKEALDPVQNALNAFRIPMTELPLDHHHLAELLRGVDAVMVTHTHRDHWDVAAQTMIDKAKPILCQPSDLEKIKAQGFTDVTVITDSLDWKGITIHRTGGQHGTGEVGKKMGDVSGFVLQHGRDCLYIAGDTIWCDEVKHALNKFNPNVTVVNAGAAQFLTGDPITMSSSDIKHVIQNTAGRIIAVHMDTVNHCLVKREALSYYLDQENLKSRVAIPQDGETILL